MELNYIKEHTSCVNYKTEEDAGFALKEAALGEHFDNRQQEIKANHLIFILSGEVSITKDSKEETRVRAGEFIFIPLSSHYTGTVIQPGTYISLSFFHDTISLCDKHMLSSYLDKAQHTPLCFEPLSVRAPLDMFLNLLESYLQAGVNCKHLHELKERELFIIFRTAASVLSGGRMSPASRASKRASALLAPSLAPAKVMATSPSVMLLAGAEKSKPSSPSRPPAAFLS